MIKFLLLTVTLFVLCSANAHAQDPIDLQYTPGMTAPQARAQWHEMTKGEELARGKKVFFSPAPNDALTTDANDPYDLTDGTLSSLEDDRVWFNSDAVGWYGGAGTGSGVLMVIDLGSVQPIGQIAIRTLGGHEQGSLDLPGSFEYMASADGEQYHALQKTVKLNEAEKNQSDGKTGFYIPETGTAYMATFVCRVPVMARYVALRVTPVNSLFTDQISVLKATSAQKITELASYPKVRVLTDGLAVLPRQEPFTVTTNIATPNWFTVLNNTNLDPKTEQLNFRLELPTGLRVLPATKVPYKEVASTHPGMNAYEFQAGRYVFGGVPWVGEGPVWIVKDKAATIPAGAKVLITGIVNGVDSHQLEYPLNLVAIPEATPIAGLDNSLAWMDETTAMQWPNFLSDYRKLGFDYVPAFAQEYSKDADGNWNEYSQKNLDFVDNARQAGYKIIDIDSPFHMMWKAVQSDLKADKIDDAEAEQLFTQVDGKRGHLMNILYRGKYLQNEIQRVAEGVSVTQPDFAYLDIEWWTESVEESRKDPRVQAAWKASGKEWDDFVTDIGTEVLGEMVAAMRRAVPDRKLIVGLYNSDPTNEIYNSVFDWKKLYPQIIDIAMPSLYVQGRPLLVADRIRYDYEKMQTRQIIPWLTAGTYGEFDPKLIEPMVLESILNGSRGVTYFFFGDFDPMDFYYHSQAMIALKPYEKVLQAGKPIDYKGDNPDLHYTAFASADEALVLVGNYNHTAQTKVLLPLPIPATKARLGSKTLNIQNNSVSVEVPSGEFRLIYISSK